MAIVLGVLFQDVGGEWIFLAQGAEELLHTQDVPFQDRRQDVHGGQCVLQPGSGAETGDPGRDVLGRERPGEEIPLQVAAAHLGQQGGVLCRFHSLGNHFQAQHAAGGDDRRDDGEILGIVDHVAHKALVDLDGMGGELLEVGQGGVAGAEVVEGDAHPQAMAGAQEGL
ncbi:hypothetical protein GGI1_24136, partial [Acidithiobacillus sp. GGI-221]